DGTLLGTATFAVESETGWQQANFPAPVDVTGGQTHTASSYDAARRGPRGPLHTPRGSTVGGNGVFRYGSSGVPTSSYNDTDYAVDVVFVMPPDTTGPSVVDRSPAIDLVSVATTSVVQATFSEAVTPASLAFTLTGPSGAVAATVSYHAPSRTATLTPSAALAQ